MTKKDFIVIAEVLNLLFFYANGEPDNEHFTNETKNAITGAFIAALKRENSRFDAERFQNAVYGVKKSHTGR